MGASCSAAFNATSTFPEELLVEILSSLPVPDLISCRRVNHYLNDIVDKSQRLQHHIDTAFAGVLDNPNSPLSLFERRDALARRQEAWDTLQPQWTTSTTRTLDQMDESPRDGKWFPLDPLRECDYRIGGLTACPDNDGLIAVSLRCGAVSSDKNWFHRNHTLEADILCFSEGGGERLCTRKRSIHVKDVVLQDGVMWSMDIQIHTKILAVHLKPQSMTLGPWPDQELWVFDWETGEKIASLRDQRILAFRLLSSSAMVVANTSSDKSTATLEVYRIPVTHSSTTLEKVAALGLPFVDICCRIAHIGFYTPPFKNFRVKGQEKVLLYNAAVDANPFISPKSSDIIFATLDIISSYGRDSISFVVHPSTLLRYTIPPHSYGHTEAPIPWESWGPGVTRWCESGMPDLGGPYTCGERCLLRPAQWELWDFNPYRARRLKHGLPVESATAYLTVETEASCAKCHGIKEGIYSSLPFVKLVPKKWPRYGYMGLYEDRVVGSQTPLGKLRCEIDHLIFG